MSGDHATTPTGGVERFVSAQQRVDKPWGHELIFAVAESYVGKLLVVKAGESLSLQFHREKDEAWYVLEGRAELELGAQDDEALASDVIGPGASFRFRPGTVHRVTAHRRHHHPRGVDARARRRRPAGRPVRAGH